LRKNLSPANHKARENGVLVLVAPSDRAIRIEVGYGLEGVLPDGLAGAIIRDELIPRFREGDFDGGIVRGRHCARSRRTVGFRPRNPLTTMRLFWRIAACGSATASFSTRA
jgi:hypothetical protein